jgi:isopentenyldiphosphate isomerase
MSRELADVLNEHGEPTGRTATKEEIFKNGWWRLVVHIWIVNPETQELLIQKRAKKGIFDDLWDVSVGGGVQAGEDSVIAAKREVEEELDLGFNESDFELIGRFRVPKFIPERQQPTNEYSDTFFVRSGFDLNQVKMQKAEVAEVGSLALSDLINLQSDHQKAGLWVPHGQEYYTTVANKIIEKL